MWVNWRAGQGVGDKGHKVLLRSQHLGSLGKTRQHHMLVDQGPQLFGVVPKRMFEFTDIHLK